MKKIISVFMLCFLLLCGCSKEGKIITGAITAMEIVDGHPVYQLVTEEGKTEYLVTNADTFIWSWIDAISAENLRTGEIEQNKQVVISAQYFEKTKHNDNTAYVADEIGVGSVLVKVEKILADGTMLDGVHRSSSVTYQLADGSELLRVMKSSGPDNVYMGGVESFSAMSETAQEKVLEYYTARDVLYNTDEYLHKAYEAKKEYGDSFGAYMLEQSVVPSASNEKLMAFMTIITLPQDDGKIVQEQRMGEIFDRNSGKQINGFDIFSTDADKAVEAIVTAGFESLGTGANQQLKEQMIANVKPEYIVLWNNAIEISYPAGALDGQEHCYVIAVEYTDSVKAVLHDWAIPTYEG